MKIKTVNNLYTDENTYIVYDEEEKNGFVIDPGNSVSQIIKAAGDVKIKYIIITHCHYDHIEFLEELREATGAKLISSKKASKNIEDPRISLTLTGLGKPMVCKKSDIILEDGEEFNEGKLNIKCIYTPGHTDCGACYLFNRKNLFVGDTLFLRNCGRWDLPTGNEKTLIGSIKNKLYKLDDDVEVYPGHGQKTSVGYEKKFNFIVKA